MKDTDRYFLIVEWSEEDGCYVGSCPGWLGAVCHGDDPADVYRQLRGIVDDWVDTFRAEGRPLPPPTVTGRPGDPVVRVSSECLSGRAR